MGVINGLLGIFSVKATTREIECQWNGAQACCYEAVMIVYCADEHVVGSSTPMEILGPRKCGFVRSR
jgi:hypothetical protein